MDIELSNENVLLVDMTNVVSQIYYADAANTVARSMRYVAEAKDFFSSSHVVACFDGKNSSTSRKAKLKQYKANRKQRPEGLTEALRDVYRAAKNVAACEVHEGYEGDDAIAAVIHHMKEDGLFEKGCQAVIASNDRDFFALLKSGEVRQFFFQGGLPTVYTEEKASEELGFPIEYYLDYRVITGDSSDNVSGVKGVGPKTASKWIRQFGSLDNIIENVDILPGPVKCRTALIEAHKNGDLAVFREVLSFRTDCPVVWRWPDVGAILDELDSVFD
ncbi:MAG: 5'-3' exonuclease [Pirellulaceae bacterium]|nr:MAG: 5'-3' exonuclease [Pirellulaceae bacterium]